MDQITLDFHKKTIWTRYASCLLGFWLFFYALSANYYYHSKFIFYSNLICGFLIFLFGYLSIDPKHKELGWGVAILGAWISIVPILAWAPLESMYLNNTIIGFLAILFGLILPGMQHDALSQLDDIPEGWTYNPSAWPQRMPVMFLALCCWFMSRYMAYYQLGYTDTIYDPFFGSEGTVKVITSALSKSFPIADAGLAAFLYSLEFILGAKGSSRRWRTMPWIVICFGILVVPVGLGSIILICCQPIIVGHWCTWCLLTAGCMLAMISLTIDEAMASLLLLKKLIFKNKMPVFEALFYGDSRITQTQAISHSETTWHTGTRIHVFNVLALLIGLWLMASPSYLHISGAAADSDYIAGALIVVVSVITSANIISRLFSLNIILGAWLILCPFIHTNHQWSNIVLGLILVGLGIKKISQKQLQSNRL